MVSLSYNLFCWFYRKFNVLFLSLPCNIKTLIQKLQGRKTCVAKLHTAACIFNYKLEKSVKKHPTLARTLEPSLIYADI